MLREFRPYFCPHDRIMSKALAYSALFLPTTFVKEGDDTSTCYWKRCDSPLYLAWKDELLGFWTACYNTPTWEGSHKSLLSRLAADNIGATNKENSNQSSQNVSIFQVK